MVTYAARAIPWLRVLLAAGLVVVLMELVRWNPWVLWPLEGTAVGLLAGATAWCFDESAAVVVNTSPRGLAWRTAARSPGVVLLALAWGLGVLRLGNGAVIGHVAAILVQGLVAIAAGAAFACLRRAEGEAVPGLLFATVVVPAVTGVGAGPALRRAPGRLSVRHHLLGQLASERGRLDRSWRRRRAGAHRGPDGGAVVGAAPQRVAQD